MYRPIFSDLWLKKKNQINQSCMVIVNSLLYCEQRWCKDRVDNYSLQFVIQWDLRIEKEVRKTALLWQIMDFFLYVT